MYITLYLQNPQLDSFCGVATHIIPGKLRLQKHFKILFRKILYVFTFKTLEYSLKEIKPDNPSMRFVFVLKMNGKSVHDQLVNS